MWRAACLWLCVAAASPAAQAAAGPDAHALLERARMAAQRLDYRGEFVLQRGPEASRTRITHRVGPPEQERLENLDGEPRESLRNGSEVLTYLPKQRRMIVERPTPEARFPALVPLSPAQLERDYVVRPFEGRQVAGRDATAIALDARDAFHYSYRFWFDRAAGLLLRAQTVSEKGEVIEQVGFRQLSIGELAQAPLRPAIGSTNGWRIDRANVRPVDLSRWRLGWAPAGFLRVATLSRTLVSASGEPREVAQILYSNGLSSLSVFIEPWSPERSLSPLRLGALNMLGKRHGNFWLTIVGDVPMVAIRQVAGAIEQAHNPPQR